MSQIQLSPTQKQGIPRDAIGFFRGSYYKIGRFGKAYYWNGSQWCKSSEHEAVLLSELGKKRNPFSLGL